MAGTVWNAALHHRLMARFQMPSLGGVVSKAANSQTANNLALLACALERYRLAQGGYPDTLAALVPTHIKKVPQDIINGKPLVYHKKADGTFILYSVGWNDKDDDGVLVVRDSGSVIPTEGDWVWQYTSPKIEVTEKK